MAKAQRKAIARLDRRQHGTAKDQTQTGGIDTSGHRPLGNGKLAYYTKPGSQNRKK